MRNLTAGTEATDAVNKTQMETAIAAAGIPSSAGTVRVSLNDTTPGYLGQKITLNGAVIVPTNPGANETVDIVLNEGQLALVSGVYGL